MVKAGLAAAATAGKDCGGHGLDYAISALTEPGFATPAVAIFFLLLMKIDCQRATTDDVCSQPG